MKPKLLVAWICIVFLCSLPVIMLFTLGPKDYSSVTHTLGQVTGLIGMTMFALTFVLSTRARWIEYLFDGLDKVYPVHAVLGAGSLMFILLHPILLVLRFIPENIALAAKYMLPGGHLSVDFGIYALIGMIVLIMFTVYGKIKYHTWKMSHEFLGLFFALAILHILLVRETVARDYIFEGYYIFVFIVSSIGLIAFLYSLFRVSLIGKKYTIAKTTRLGDSVELIIVPVSENHSIEFKAGQFVFVKFKNKIVGSESHPFSIASPSGRGQLRIIAKNLGDYTSTLSNLSKGDELSVEGPYGMFHQHGFKDEIWVAGGIGVTPFLGLSVDLCDSKTGSATLFYSVKNKSEFIHLEELQQSAKKTSRFKLVPWISEDMGYLNVTQIEKFTPTQNKNAYLCGPQSLKEAIRTGLKERNIPSSDIHDERFAFK